MNTFDFDAHTPSSDLVLAAGLAVDVPEIGEWLAQLPSDAYGCVFIESDEPVPAFDAPAGVAICRVKHFFEPGVALAEAVDAWFDEWVWAESDVQRSLQMWTPTGEAPAFGACGRRMQRLLGRRAPAVAQAIDLAN